jgi:sugar phosphate isomerase/epimerase
MAKLAAFPKCYFKDIVQQKMSLEEWIELGSKLPVDGLELYLHFLPRFETDYLRDVRNRIADKGMEMPMLCHSPDFTVSSDVELESEISKQRKAIEVTAALGGRYCRTLSGQRRPELSLEEGVDRVVGAIESCFGAARDHGVVLVIENHYKDDLWEHPEFAQKKDPFLSIVNRIASPEFGVQFDPSNAIVAGDDPLDLLDSVKQRVRTMHASDRFIEPGYSLDDLRASDGTIGYSPHLKHGVIGKGLNDYDAIMRTLKGVGFDGWISIEDGINGLDEMDESARFLRAKMVEHGFD